MDVVGYAEMKNLHFQMIDLIIANKSILKETGILLGIIKIIIWIQYCEQGYLLPERKLFLEALAMLENTKMRIRLGMMERQRIESESPMVTNNLSRTDEEDYDAAFASAEAAVSDFTNLIEQ